MYNFIKEQYKLGYFSQEEVLSFVPLFINQEEANNILEGGNK